MARVVAACLLLSVLILAESGMARGQFVAGPVGGFGFGYQHGFSFSFGGPYGRVGGYFGSSFGVAAPLPGLNGVANWGVGPGWGWGWPEPILVAEPPLIVVPPPVAIAGGFPMRRDGGFRGGFGDWELPPLVDARAPAPPDPAARARVDAAVERGDLIPIRPRPDDVRVAVKEPQPRESKPVPPAVVPGAKPPLVPLPKDPRELAALRIQSARTAFAEEQYGRAADHFAAAAKLAPDDPLPQFLLAQVQTARGEYAEAVAAIRDGMKKSPDWPASRFRLKELYSAKPERFDSHLGDLRAAVNKNPEDPALAFLLGYHLWFLGEREAATRLFKYASPRVKDNATIERFLREAIDKDS